MNTTKEVVKGYMGKFTEGEEFSMGHMLILSLVATVPIGVSLVALKGIIQLSYSIFS